MVVEITDGNLFVLPEKYKLNHIVSLNSLV